MSLYDEIGGDEALTAALDAFYGKVMADPRVSVFFEGVDVERVKKHQREFLAMAFGGPSRYQGRDLRSAHRGAVGKGLNEPLFEVFMGHFRDTLAELGVGRAHIDQIMEIAAGGRDDVLQR